MKRSSRGGFAAPAEYKFGTANYSLSRAPAARKLRQGLYECFTPYRGADVYKRQVYDGVRVPDLVSAEARREARRAWAVPDDEVLLGYVAHLVPGKNHEALLRALPEMLARRPGCRLILAGDGPRRRELEEMSRALKIESRVIFAGFVGDVAQLYRALDVFLFPALGEGLGSSLLDAMAHGLPLSLIHI